VAQVHIVVDSIAQISQEMLDAHANLHMISLKVRLGDREWHENEIAAEELFRLEKANKTAIKTSQPAPGEFVEIFEPLIAANHEIVVISVSGGLSGTVEGARMAAKMVDEKRIFVVDSHTASIGMVQMARAALTMAERNRPAAEIAEEIREMAKYTHTLIVPDTLEYLHKGGRIGGAAALFGSILQIRPVLYLGQDGKVAVLDKVRTKQRAINRMLEEVQNYKDLEYIGVGHIDVPEEGKAIREKLQSVFPKVPVLPALLGSVLGAHLGPGLLGIVFQEKTGK
jgi:DegV family protein with EDD domain